MNGRRTLRHLLAPHWLARRAFSPQSRRAIEAAVAAAEAGHRAELRFVIEGPLALRDLVAGSTPRARAEALFSSLRVWDTAENSGVLVYVNVVDRAVELVADRGVHALAGEASWRAIVGEMEAAYRAGRFEQGSLAAIARLGQLLREHFPRSGENPDELPNAPLLV